LGQAEGCGQRDILRPQPLAGLQRGIARRNILARGTDIGAGLQARRQHHLAVLEADVFLHEHGIGTIRHRRTGEDAHRLPWPDRRLRGSAGLNPPGHGKRLLLLLRQIAARHRIAIDGGIGERRQRQRCGNIMREDAPIGAASVTVSTSDTAMTRAAMMPTASSTDSIGPPKAKQSSDSCAIAVSALRFASRQHLFDRDRRLQHHGSDRLDIIEMGG